MTLAVFSAASGQPSLRYGDHPLEDPNDPVEGARNFVDAERLGDAERVVLFGAGLGYRVARLEALGVAEPIVYEPCKRVLDFEVGPRMGQAHVFTELTPLLHYLLEVGKPEETTLLLVPPTYRRAFPDGERKLERALWEAQGLLQLKRNTVAERSALLVERAIANLPRLCSVPMVDAVGAPLTGTPAFVVSAGPSLDKNRKLLKQAGTRGAVFVVNTAAPVMAATKTEVDLLMAIEALDVSEPLRIGAPYAKGFGLDLTAGGGNYEAGLERGLAFLVAAPQFAGLAERIGTEALPYGASVATAAFALAIRLGADPVVLVGQDLAYTDGRGYASDTLFEATRVRRQGETLVIERAKKWNAMTEAGGLKVPSQERPLVEVPAWGGGTVDSTHDLGLFRRWFEAAAVQVRGFRRLINATEGGASVPGFEELPLAEVLRALPRRKDRLHEAIEQAPRSDGQRLAALAEDIERNALEVRAAARRLAQLVDKGGADRTHKAEARLRAAAERAPLVDAHAATGIMAIEQEKDLSPAQRRQLTYRAIADSASRVASTAGEARRQLPGQ